MQLPQFTPSLQYESAKKMMEFNYLKEKHDAKRRAATLVVYIVIGIISVIIHSIYNFMRPQTTESPSLTPMESVLNSLKLIKPSIQSAAITFIAGKIVDHMVD